MADNNPYVNPYYSQYQQNAYASNSSNPYASNPYYSGVPGAGPSRPQVANAHEYDVGAAAQQSAYVPGANAGKNGGAGSIVPKGQKRKTVLRKGGGWVWEDQTLLEWDDSWFRLFVGDVSNDVTDEVLSSAFAKYPTFQKARVIRDKLSSKAKFGFVAFSDPEDFLKAWKEMDGKYVGNRPIRLKKAESSIHSVEIGHNKAKRLEQDRRDRRKKPSSSSDESIRHRITSVLNSSGFREYVDSSRHASRRPLSTHSATVAVAPSAAQTSRRQPGSSQRVATPEEVSPPPYSRYPDGESSRKVTFLVTTALGDNVTLSAKRSVRMLKALEAACNIFKLQPSKCRLQHAGRVYGHGDMDRMTLGSLDIEDGDRLEISWDNAIVRSELWLRAPTTVTEETAGAASSIVGARVTVALTQRWSFDVSMPAAPIDVGDSGSKISWQVRTQLDGQLAVAEVPQPVPCLSWEAQVKPLLNASAPATRDGADNPSAPAVTQPEPSTPTVQVGDGSPTTAVAPSLPAPQVSQDLPVLLTWMTMRNIFTAFVLHFLATFIRVPSSGSSSKVVEVPPPRGVGYPLDDDSSPFDPLETSTTITDRNSIIVLGSGVEQYLRVVFKEVGVPQDITDKFLSRRLPAMVRHKWIALRFLSAKSFSSSVRILPEPEALIRAVLVYSGVPAQELHKWPVATRRFTDARPCIWKDVICGAQAPSDGYMAYELGWIELFLD
ncbi:hypothetical protein FRB99_005411 [Tulasnella sp. 403]|nr:hypothetical protein FRB99_005411 [Tulasnella sp. 403]